jgi:hypothetical protein
MVIPIRSESGVTQMKEFMSDEARRYYGGGKRVMKDGVPCRVAAWAGRTPGKAFIKTAVAAKLRLAIGVEHGDMSLARVSLHAS